MLYLKIPVRFCTEQQIAALEHQARMAVAGGRCLPNWALSYEDVHDIIVIQEADEGKDIQPLNEHKVWNSIKDDGWPEHGGSFWVCGPSVSVQIATMEYSKYHGKVFYTPDQGSFEEGDITHYKRLITPDPPKEVASEQETKE